MAMRLIYEYGHGLPKGQWAAQQVDSSPWSHSDRSSGWARSDRSSGCVLRAPRRTQRVLRLSRRHTRHFLLGLYRPASFGMWECSLGVCVGCGYAGRLGRSLQLKIREAWGKRKMLGEKPCHSTCNHRSVRSSTLYTSVRSGILSRIAVRSHMLLFSVFVFHWCTK